MLMRPYSSWSSPWRDMERLRREMNRLFSQWPTQGMASAAGYPALNLWADEESAVVTAELPGVDMEDMDVSVENETLTLRGRRQLERTEKDVTYHRQERRQGSFARTLRLPFRVDAENVEATFKNGVLNIVLPRAEEEKPTKISVRAG